MSRIGRAPISIPANVEVSIDGGVVKVKGPNGELTFTHHPKMTVAFDGEAREVRVTRPDDTRESRALHGLTRSLVNNMVQGVQTYYEKKLEVVGVGYQASLQGNKVSLQVGFANTIVLEVPKNVICEVPSQTLIVVRSMDKQAAGQFAAEIRHVRPPEPYKGKGIRYQGEYVRRKAGKAFAS